ncbi:MAG: exodeoxyribonuclease VII large subunit [Burkholderiales bacterium PBB4]|nr:MAG: exodeoxyribonuclease VII large subunit [Burkholderiales bacterium PBB4]
MDDSYPSIPRSRVWRVGALCSAIADALDARFNPISVEGEISGFSRAASGHCYFTLKDESGQLRCAMFRRAAGLLDFVPKDGDKIELSGKLSVYETRGELQLVVETMRKAGQGGLLEEFLKLKLRLEREGLFDSSRKRPLPNMPFCIGVVTSLGAAALHDVLSALQRRVPHIRVVIAPASVQGVGAPAELVGALQSLYAYAVSHHIDGDVPPDLILLVRGGGALEDLWAFNDEAVARTIALSPVPVICGVGHETDFTIADFVADLRAPTPTAAAELAARPAEFWTGQLNQVCGHMQDAALRHLDRLAQRLDIAAARLGRPSTLAHQQRLRLGSLQQRLSFSIQRHLQTDRARFDRLFGRLTPAAHHTWNLAVRRVQDADLKLGLLDPGLVLQRGYAWLTLSDGTTLSHVQQALPGQDIRATLVDGTISLLVNGQGLN